MQIDTTLGGLESSPRAAAAAEAAGYDGVFTGELNHDPFLPLVLAAGATERIDIGTSIAVAFSRSPMSVAYTAYDLQRFSIGTWIAGQGARHSALLHALGPTGGADARVRAGTTSRVALLVRRGAPHVRG
jgi:alkanesulfonate monooxygenase SsuD/methylene tetrahydromethanopterin reductase-like flavin-dependent oxidoreductase (luciferase family)